jgi:hypothetical protein
MAGEKFIYGNNPYIPINYFQNMADPNQQGRDWLTRYAKGGLKNLAAGKDVSNFGELNSIAQTAAMQRQQAQEGQGMGAAALMSAQGGEQEGLQRAITNKAVNQINTQQGMADVNALSNLQNYYSNTLRQGQQMEQQQNQWANNLYLQALGMKYPQAYDPYHQSFGQQVAGQVIGAALGAGGAYGKQQGWWGG